MSIFVNKGAAAVNSAATNESGEKEAPIVSFKSGTSYKVGIKSINDVAEYYGYSSFNPRVNTFVPKNPATRNARGYVTDNPTVWDRAADLLYADAKQLEESGAAKADVDKVRQQASNLRGKPRFLRAFFDLDSGKDIVIDLSAAQERAIKAVIQKYEKRLGKLAFELSKQGSSTQTTVSLSPIIDMDEDLTDEQRKNFEKLSEAPFDMDSFEACLYVADEEEQIKNLVIVGFDIGRLGLSIGAGSDESKAEATPIEDEGQPAEDDLGF